MNRRVLLLAAGFGGLVAACSGPGSRPAGSTASATAATGPATAPSTTTTRPAEAPIDTLVVLMLENRSFDHHFGALPGVDGVLGKDLSNPRGAGGEPVAPYHLDDACTEKDLDHSFTGSHEQFDDGRNDGFVTASGEVAMGYREPADLPFTSALAAEFTVCDRWFCSVLGPTFPNRHYLHSGTADGRTRNVIEAFPKPSIWNRLEEAGVQWGYYYGDLPFLGLYPDVFGRGRDRGAVASLERYFRDAAAGRLPRVAFVEPVFNGPAATDDHPPHNSQFAQRFAAQVFGALASSPHWERSLFVLTYDEHGGFFDHVAPPPVVDDHAAAGFDHLGFRVPAMLAGPYVKRHFVSSVTYEHSSVPHFIEWRFGLRPMGVRDAQAANLLDALDFTKGDPTVPRLPVPALDPAHAVLCEPVGTATTVSYGARARPEGDGMALLAELFPWEPGYVMPVQPTHPSLVEV